MNQETVVIIGAGPVGLTMAAFLAYYKIPFRIIDKKSGPTLTSNAVGVHARTLELFDELGLSAEFLKEGQQINHFSIFLNKHAFLQLPLNKVESHYNFIIDIPQSKTEEILLKYLENHQIFVEWNTTCIEINLKSPSETELKLKKENNEELLNASWVIASDGYHSFIREKMLIPFVGKEYSYHFMMIDAPIEGGDNYTSSLATDSQMTCFIFPMKNSARILLEMSKINDLKDKAPSQAIFQGVVDKLYPFPIKIGEPKWTSSFYIHERLIENYKKSNVFFMGDAAHVHSPAGAQGMNTGMQDAINLSWKLALVIKKLAPESLLDSYEIERKQIGKKILAMTDLMTQNLGITNPLLIKLRAFLMPKLMQIKRLQKKVVNRLGQVSLSYKNPHKKSRSLLGFKIGERFPFFFEEKFEGKYFILDFNHELKNFSLNSSLFKMINVHHVPALAPYLNKPFYLIIRPDGYIEDLGKDSKSFENWLILNKYLLQ